MTDLPGIAALVGSLAALFGAAAFAIRSRVKLEEMREQRRASAEDDLREDRDAWKARAERAESGERALAAELHDRQIAKALGAERDARRLKP